MRICILTPRFPFPECGGDLLRINNIAQYLKKKGHHLTLISYIEDEPDIETARSIYDDIHVVKRSTIASLVYSALFMLRQRPIQCGYYYSRRFSRLFKSVAADGHFDLYISHLLRMVPFIENQGLQQQAIIEMTDALSKTYSLSVDAKGSRLRRIIYRFEKSLIRRCEQHVVNCFPKVVLVSQADIDYLNQNENVRQGSMSLHSNGVVCREHIGQPYDPHKICFIGHMQSLQNQDAVFHFVSNIFPLILAKDSQAKLYVVGAHPPQSIQKLDNGNNVFVTGFVEDLNGFIADSCVAVAPVRIAAGIQNKVLVAMGCGIPVVLTPLIAKSIPELTDGQNCLIRDDAASFAAACLSLMENKDMRQDMAKRGNEVVRRCYSWDEKLSGYEQFSA